MKVRSLALCWVLSVFTACGPESQGERPNEATCEPDRVHLVGEVDGRAIDESHDVSSFAFGQLGDPSLDMTFGESGTVHLEWGGLVANGEEAQLSLGELVMPGSSDTLTSAEGSSLVPTGDAYQFRLYWADGSSVDGCYGQAEF